MSYEDEDQGNEYANGAAGRFNNLDLRFKKGGKPRERPAGVTDAINAVHKFYYDQPVANNEDLFTLQIIHEMKAVKDAKEAADLLAKELGRQYDYLRLIVIPERFDAEGIKNMKVDGVGRVQLAVDLYAGVVKGNEEEAYTWLDDNGRGDIVKKTVNSSSIKAVLKKMMQSGEEIPEKLFKAEPFTRASIVKA